MKQVTLPGLVLLLIVLTYACNGSKQPSGDGKFRLSDPGATSEAQHLYDSLCTLSGKGILIGHQDALAYGIGWKGNGFRTDMNDMCGKHPAVFGWDLGHIGEANNIDGVLFHDMKKWAIAAYDSGGINTYSWHMRNLVSGGNSWDITPAVNALLPGGEFHDRLLQKLDSAAGFFGSLKTHDDRYIPVIFRPFHEMNGGWFWWGSNSCKPEEYIQLFRFTVDYLRDVKNLHHILYVYSTDVFLTPKEYQERYPGNAYVDILGFDDYKGLRNQEQSYRTVKMLEILDSLAIQWGKLFAVSETGLETIPDPKWFTGVVLSTLKTNTSTRNVSWILFWRNGRKDHFYVPYPGHSSEEDFKIFEQDPITLFLSDIPGMN